MPTGLTHSLLRMGRYMLLLTLSCLLSMIIAYALVRHLTRGQTVLRKVDPEAIQQARLLRRDTNQLVALANEYSQRLPQDTKAPAPATIQWIDGAFRPELNALRQRMDEEFPTDTPLCRTLSATADRAAAMAAHPDDAELRRRALRDIEAAAARIEKHLDTLGLEHWLPQPPLKPRFAIPAWP